MNDTVIKLIRSAIWDEAFDADVNIDWWEVFDEMKQHAVSVLPASKIKDIILPDDVRSEWKKHIYSQILRCNKLVYLQNKLLEDIQMNNIPVVVLKGTSAAKYYKKSEYRIMGDIDILVPPDYFDECNDFLINAGYSKIIDKEKGDNVRHKTFNKDGIEIELHRYFSSPILGENAKILDNILYNNIELGRTVLDDMENGLVLIEHIAQHLREGIGLRQVIDWMLFVNSCLHDMEWEDKYKEIFDSVGLTSLAKTITRMCQIFLGLPLEKTTWCNTVDEEMCNNMMSYILNSGNFGCSRTLNQSSAITRLPSLANPIEVFRYLQSHGKENWSILRSQPWLSPLSWCYQVGWLCKQIMRNSGKFISVKSVYRERKTRIDLFNYIGFPQLIEKR